MYNNLFIVIEGIDGSGKSIITSLLAKKLSALAVTTPIGLSRRHRGFVENSHPTLRFIYYALANHVAGLFIRSQLKKGHVVCDRYTHSTKAHHIGYGCPLAYHTPLWLLSNCHPDLVYYLTVSQEEQEKRIRNRPGNSSKDIDSKSLRKIHRIFLSLPGLIEIDTTNLTPETIVNIILHDINKRTSYNGLANLDNHIRWM